MIVRTYDEIIKKYKNTDRNVESTNWASRRLLTKEDGMGFALTVTTVYEGTETELCYKNHFEACYCIEGEGEVEALEPEPKTYPLKVGSVYALDKHDKHIIRAKKTMVLVCVFYPAITGKERHDADGSYAASD